VTKLVLLVLTAALTGAPADGVAGKWTLTVDTGASHGIATMGLVLKQEGQKISGTFQSPHGDLPVEGRFADGTLELSTASEETGRVTLTANLRENGTLAGHLSTSRGDMKLTGERTAEKKDKQ
jgi:hypothetical protein